MEQQAPIQESAGTGNVFWMIVKVVFVLFILFLLYKFFADKRGEGEKEKDDGYVERKTKPTTKKRKKENL